MAALYDGNDNRTFMMEYTPELQRQDSKKKSETEETSGSRRKKLSEENLPDSDIQGETGGKEDFPTGNGEESGGEGLWAEEMPDGKEASGAKAFWYGVLCQMADIFLPAPTSFKAWLHEKMGFTDGISALWTEEIYEADLSVGTLSVQEAESPFALMETIFAGTSGESLSSDAYRQVSYVNDINRANVQAVMEYTVNGGMGESVISYSFGMQRESYTMTLPGLAAGNGETSFRVEGTYYYTGTGSVSNLTGTGGSGRSYAYALSGEACTFAMYQGETAAVNITAGTYSAYAYNGEYTHQGIGLQYLRARYLSLETGTFLSRDTYAGRVWDILSQNRYTYAENNPVNYADPSGHVKAVKGIGSTVGSKVMGGLGNLKSSFVPAVTKKSTGTASRNTSLSAGGTGLISVPKKLPSLLDNIKIHNGDKYYNNLVVWTPINTLMHSPGSSMSFAEAVALKEEAARCLKYEYAIKDYQEIIEQDEVMVVNGESIYYILSVFSEIVLDKNTGVVTEQFHYPGSSWGIVGSGKYTEESAVLDNGIYQIAVAPKIVNPQYPDDGHVLDTEYEIVESITLIIENKKTGMLEILECDVKDAKAHSYNKYPDGQENNSLPYKVIAGIKSGLVQTGIAYPNSDNAKKSKAFAPDNIDASIIEFAGQSIDFNIDDYNLKSIIVNYE